MLKEIKEELWGKMSGIFSFVAVGLVCWGFALLVTFMPQASVSQADVVAVLILMVMGACFYAAPVGAIVKAAYKAGQNSAFRAAGNEIFETGRREKIHDASCKIYGGVRRKSYELGCDAGL
ncbi:MAG: hypothetical protein V1895_04180 [Parcubacteria group bacterium]